jgi:N-acetylmuramoyl-L-alanine amidase
MKRLLAVFMLLIPGPVLAAPVVSAVSLTAEPDSAHLELVLSAATPLHVFYLDNPYRIAIELQGTDWRAAPAPAAADSLVSGLRHGQQKSGAARLVVDLAAPARIATADYLASADATTTRLVIDLRQVTASSFRRAMASASRPTSWAASANAKAPTDKASPDKTAPEAAIQPAAGPATGTATAKKPLPDPLLTSAYDDLIQREQEASRDSELGITSPDGYFITYMHPPGSLLGAGVTVGTQF